MEHNAVECTYRLRRFTVGWSLTALSAQKGYIVPVKEFYSI